jgi:RHS repeat-associated protein
MARANGVSRRMMPVIKHFDPVMGVDIHIVVLPPGVPTPMPHPHIAMIIDPMDYVPVLGATVFIGPLPRASAGTAGKPIPHIPMGGPFVKPPMNEAEIFMGSATVLADGDPLSFTALPVLSCQDVGMISPPRKKPKRSYGMVLPLSIVMGIPLGMPVLVGGPPTINMMALGMAAAMKALGPALKKLRGLQKKSARVKKISDAVHKRANKLMDKLGVPPNIRNKVHKSICTVTGHPVDVASGKLFTDAVDFQLPGPIPLKWERTWFSTSVYSGPLAHGWHHNYDLELVEGDKAIAVRLADGRPIAFPRLEMGDSSFDRAERLTLIRDSRGYAIDASDGLRYRFENSILEEQRHRLKYISHKAMGVRIQFEYDSQNLLRQIIDSGGRFIRLEYNTDNQLHKIFLPNPENHRVEEWVCAVEYHYSDGELVRVDDTLQQPWIYEYQNHLLIKETYRNGLSFYFRFDGRDHNARCVETWGDAGIYYRKLSYDLENNITQVWDSLGYVITYHHNQVVPQRIIDSLNSITTIEYNEYSQIVCGTNALGFKKTFEYDDFGNTTSITNPDGSACAMAYDQNHNLVSVEDVVGGKWQFRYNNHNRMVEEVDPLGNKTSYGYDDVVLTSITDPNQNRFLFQYDQHLNLCSIVDQKGLEVAWQYDALGNLVSITDPRGNKRVFNHDILRRITLVSEPDGNVRHLEYDPGNNITRARDKYSDVLFQYQGMGRVALRSQGGTTVKFEYDTEEQLKAIINEYGKVYEFAFNPIGGVLSESGFDGLTRTYLHDALGQIRRVQRPDGRHSTYTYDSAGRTTEVVHYNGEREKYEYRADGALLKASNAAANLEFKRDAFGKVLKEICGSYWVASEYDALGYRIRVTSSFGLDQKITRGSQGHVTKVSVGDAEQFITSFTRDDTGAELQRAMPGGLQSRWRRDKLGRPVQHDIIGGQKSHSSKTYVWGMDDRLTKIIDALGREALFHHDVFGNLTAAQYGANNFDLRMPDAVGNLFRTEAKKDREYGPAGQLLAKHDKDGVTRYQYDAEGNLISKAEPRGEVWRYEWSATGFLRAVIRPDGREVKFEYDPLGRRISKNFNGKINRWVWDGNNPLHEWVESVKPSISLKPATTDKAAEDEVAADQREIALQPLQSQAPPVVSLGDKTSPATWLFDPESFAPMAKMVEGHYYPIVTDYLGTPIAMFDDAGNKVWSADITVWGDLRNLNGERHACPFRWPGQYEDEETGLYYNRFRYYAPDSGQYVSQDPLGMLAGMQLYGYVFDPNCATDPLGLLGVGDIHPQTGNPILAVAEEGDKIDYLVEGSKPSMQGKLVKEVYYENPGHHDPKGGAQPYNPKKSVLPDNHVELFNKSVPYNGARYAMDANGNIHQFQDSVGGTYHWAGQEGGKTLKGKNVPLVVPKGVREMCK